MIEHNTKEDLAATLDSFKDQTNDATNASFDLKCIDNAKLILSFLDVNSHHVSVKQFLDSRVMFIYKDGKKKLFVVVGPTLYTLQITCEVEGTPESILSYTSNISDPSLEQHLLYFFNKFKEITNG